MIIIIYRHTNKKTTINDRKHSILTIMNDSDNDNTYNNNSNTDNANNNNNNNNNNER